jgi:hypothetical protein
MVVNIKTNKIEVKHELPTLSLTDKGAVHAQVRRARYTAQGTYLVSLLTMDQVIEYDKKFKEIWKYDIKSPWAAIRLKNGNTLIADEKDQTVREVTPQKKTIWELKPSDLPEASRYVRAQSVTRLANGNTIICARGAEGWNAGDSQGRGVQLVEVTPDKKVVWVLYDWAHFGPATAVQILNDPGIPEIPGQSEH